MLTQTKQPVPEDYLIVSKIDRHAANLCTESHMRELIEQGFDVAVVSDATAAAIVGEGDGYEAALVNFRFIANTVWTTEETVQKINNSK